jgi:hypothetical protein
MSNDQNDIVEFPAKYAKVLKEIPEFKDTADAAGTDDLKKMIITQEGNSYTIDKEKEADSKYQAAKSLAKEYSQPYRDAQKVIKAKIQYCLFLLEQKGIDLDNKD